MASVLLLITRTSRHWSHLHFNGLEGIVPTFIFIPDYVDIFKPNGTTRCVHAVGIGHVASIVPESSKVVLSAVVTPIIIVFVKGRELHVVVISKTVS